MGLKLKKLDISDRVVQRLTEYYEHYISASEKRFVDFWRVWS